MTLECHMLVPDCSNDLRVHGLSLFLILFLCRPTRHRGHAQTGDTNAKVGCVLGELKADKFAPIWVHFCPLFPSSVRIKGRSCVSCIICIYIAHIHRASSESPMSHLVCDVCMRGGGCLVSVEWIYYSTCVPACVKLKNDKVSDYIVSYMKSLTVHKVAVDL